MENKLTTKQLQLEAQLKHYRDLEIQLREELRQSETSRSELRQRLEVCRREAEIVVKLSEVGKKLDRLRRTVSTEKQLTVINQRKLCREIAALRQQLSEATEKLKATETVTMATRRREIQEATNEFGELREVWERMGIKHTLSVDTGRFLSGIFVKF